MNPTEGMMGGGDASARRMALANMMGAGGTAPPPPREETGGLEQKVEAAVRAIDDLSASLSGEKARRLDEIAEEIKNITTEVT